MSDHLRAPHYALPGALLIATLAYVGIEAAVAGPDVVGPKWLFQWRLLPAFLWVAAAPLLVREGERWPGWDEGRLRLLAWAAGFLALHAGVNLVIRLPDAPARGARWLLADTADGAVHYAPAALLLYILLLAAGYWLSGGEVATGGEAGAGGGGGDGTNGGAPEPMTFHGGDRTHVIPPNLIRWAEAEGDYVRVHATDHSFLVRGTMKSLERSLRTSGSFVRIHRSTLVGMRYVREVRPLRHGDYLAVLDDGTELRVPRTRRDALSRLRNGD